jgi:tryptophanyl-tRNA synthetase
MNSNNKTVLTGDRPTGQLHLGHYVGSLQNRVALQSQYDSCFYMVADVQALTDNYDNPQKVRDNVIQVLADNIAVGVDPTKTTMFIQSMVPEIAELTVFFMNLVTVNQLMHNPTIKTEISQKSFSIIKGVRSKEDLDEDVRSDHSLKVVHDILGFPGILLKDDIFDSKKFSEMISGTLAQDLTAKYAVPVGFLSYPISQAADILFARASVIPVGEDQMPVLEVARDIARKFNALYKVDLFPEPQGLLSETTRLVGTDGNAKASKSLGNAIYLGDSAAEIEKKVKGMFTCPSKVSITDKVTAEELEGNVVFKYLDIFDTRTDEIAELKQKYMNGDADTGDSVIKKRLVEVLETLLAPIRARREELLRDPEALMKIALDGSARARAVAQETMKQVRSAMKIDY